MIALEQNYNSLILAYEKQEQEIESMRQQLATSQEDRDMYRGFYETGINNLLNMKAALNNREAQIVMLREALAGMERWASKVHDGYPKTTASDYAEPFRKTAREALAATDDLSGCVLCDAEEVAFFYEHAVTKETALSRILDDECIERGWKTTILYRTWEPK